MDPLQDQQTPFKTSEAFRTPCAFGSIIRRLIRHPIGLSFADMWSFDEFILKSLRNEPLWHMGIYVGPNLVIHFCGERKKEKFAIVRADSLAVFEAGEVAEIHKSPTNGAHGRAVCEEAWRILRDPNNSYNNRYDLVRNNCEHFTSACFQVPYYGC